MATSEEKRWAKEARLRRQALKKAAMPPTNLFQARIRRTELNHRPRSHVWLWLLFLIAAGGAGAAWWSQRAAPVHDKQPAAVLTPAAPNLAATLQASSAPVVTPVAVSVAPVVNTDAAVSTVTPHAVLPDSREWHGATSNIQDVRQVVIKSGKRWRALWAEMGRTDDAPRINFYDHVVVGIFSGPKEGAGYEVQMDPPQETNDAVSVPYHVIAPLPESPWARRKHTHGNCAS